jgi:glycosyltransferase involved in cell wall biosynthesis
MYRGKTVALVIPAYNEEALIRPTLERVPLLVDRIFVVDDKSPDRQNEVILDCANRDPRITLIRNQVNLGPGGSIIAGYRNAASEKIDISVVVGGDNQMDLSQITDFLDPIIDNRADYTKGNRFLSTEVDETIRRMPKLRIVANWIITGLTKTASGYFKIMDVVDGYTAINLRAIETINWDIAWKKYGYPMDFLIRLNAYGFRTRDISRTAIYLPGVRQSQIKGFRYMMTVSPMLIRGFFWRLRFKYLYRDFHPLVFFYAFSFVLIPFGLAFGGYLAWDKIFSLGTEVTGPKAILVAMSLISGLQFLLFAMLFEVQENA